MFPLRPRIPPITISAIGVVVVVGSLVRYEIDAGSSASVSTSSVDVLEQFAFATLGAVFVGLLLIFFGATRVLQLKAAQKDPLTESSSTRALLSALASPQSSRILVITAVTYGLLFGVISSSLVFQPGIVSSQADGANVPSLALVVCCGSLGQMPQLVLYVTQHFSILVIPMNLVLLFTVSWLVGFNAVIAKYAFASRSRRVGAKWLTGLGGIVGLFTVCPSCAGFFFLSVIGLTGATALFLTLGSLQAIFILVGVPLLLISPVLALRKPRTSKLCDLSKATSING